MTRFTLTVAAVLLLASVSAAGGQTPAGAPAQPPAGPLLVPRVELGGSLGLGVGWVSDEPGAAAVFLPGGRVGVALNRRWALEGVFDVMAGDNDLAVIYRAQARWLFRSAAAPGGLQPHLTFGGTGGFERDTWGSFEWRDAAGVLHLEPRQSDWRFMPPILPTIGIGVQKTLGAHFALRADLAAIVVPADDFVGVLLMPSVSLSVPIGRYPVRSR